MRQEQPDYLDNPDQYNHPFDTSPLSGYLSKVDHILECPTVKRRANLLYDYGMLAGTAGRESIRSALPVLPIPRSAAATRSMQGIPLLIEEHETFYNEVYDDAMWSNDDQITARHSGRATSLFLERSPGGRPRRARTSSSTSGATSTLTCSGATAESITRSTLEHPAVRLDQPAQTLTGP